MDRQFEYKDLSGILMPIVLAKTEPRWLSGLIERILGVLNSLVDPQWVQIRMSANDKLIINSLIHWYMA
jgi:hypothetical protein